MGVPFIPTVTKMFYGPYEFVPVPLIGWNTTLIKVNDESLFLETTLELTGTLCDFAGESGQFRNLFDKKDELQAAVTASGQELTIDHNGIPVLSGVFPTLDSLTFDEGTWTTQITYSLTFVFNEEIEGKPAIRNFSETWGFTENEDRRSVEVQHDISAEGANTAPSGANNAFANARSFVLGKTGYGNVPSTHPVFVQASGALPSGLDIVAYEGLRQENIDVSQASFSVVEQFILSSGNFTHDQNAQFSTDSNGITSVSIDGNIRGLGRGDICFLNALSAWNINVEPTLPGKAVQVYSRFAGSGTLFTSRPKSLSISENEFFGTISYNREYDDDPSSDLPSNIQDASVAVTNTEPVEIHATIPICNRSQGAIVQNVGTTSPGTWTVNGSVTAKAGEDISVATAFAQTLINDNLPTSAKAGHTFQTIILTSKSITKDELRRQVNFNLQWQYTSSTFASDGPVQISC